MNLNISSVICLLCLSFIGVYGDIYSEIAAGYYPCTFTQISFHQCKQNETCVKKGNEAFCHCKPEYKRNENGSCIRTQPEPSSTPAPNTSVPAESGGFGFKVVLWLIIPVLLACAIAGIVYTGRQKMWLNRLYRMRIRSYNNVMVSNQDEDDPPIA